ncbi:MAG: VWA domain-containing protein [Desulfobacterales bacterium]|nr:VWA domain-containing protein [Desulfobacterales bacterium]
MAKRLTGNKYGAVLITCLAVALGCCSPVAAQSIGKVTLNYIEASTAVDRLSNQVSVYVTVSDIDEKTIPGLDAEAFNIIEDGRAVADLVVAKATDAMSVILAIDTSGSMQAHGKSGRTSMEAAKSAAIEFISLLGESDRVALYTFNNEPLLRMDFTTDHQAAIGEVQKIDAKHNAATCLYDTAYNAIKKAAEIPKGRRAIILLTDGKDEKGKLACSRYTSNDVIDAATTKAIRVPVYTIGAGPRVDERELGRIASFTGGRYLQAASMDELDDFFRTIAGQLKNQYVIRYNTHTPSGEHSLVLKVRYQDKAVQDEKRFWSPPLPVLKPPVVAFEKPGFSGPVEGILTFRLIIDPADTTRRVRYYVDALLKRELSIAPFNEFQFDTTGLPGGLHIIRGEVLDVYGQTVSGEVTITVKAPPPEAEPGKVPQPVDSGLNTILIAVGGVVLLLVVVCIGWSFRRKGDRPETRSGDIDSGAQAETDDEDDGDETMFMPDVDALSPDNTATLTVVESDKLAPGKVFSVSATTRIGRTAKNDIDIPDKSVSRKHAEIYFENGAYHIRDLGSQNGVKVNDVRVSLTGMPLTNGAIIRLGPQTVLEFAWQSGDMDETSVAPDDSTKIY